MEVRQQRSSKGQQQQPSQESGDLWEDEDEQADGLNQWLQGGPDG